jgi:predicted 3-demethylubiquinone-9 3-methyltransferase (glyoxalase superfamily)
MKKNTPFLWFDDEAEEAAAFYTSIFNGSSVDAITRYGEVGPGPKGSVMTVVFQIEGHQFIALNGGPLFKFTEAISFVVDCETQQEIDELWASLSAGGKEAECGWLKDRYGLSWQIVPTVLGEMMNDKDPKKSQRVMKALLRMKKLDVAGLEKAYHEG